VTTPGDALAARWRRLDARVQEVRAGVDSADPHQCHDAVAGALDALYDLWEFWTTSAQLTSRGADDRVRGESGGELTAALVHARGGKSHEAVEFGDFTDTYSDSYFYHYGYWRWQAHSDPKSRFAERDAWYAAHVAHQEVLPVLETALTWLRQQPELH